MRVEGMDCSACAIKVENALKRLPGVSEINMSYSTETLSMQLDENRTSREAVEGKIRALGYTPKSLNAPMSATPIGTAEDQEAGEDRPWWKTRRGRMVLGLGGSSRLWDARRRSLWAGTYALSALTRRFLGAGKAAANTQSCAGRSTGQAHDQTET
jgi:copper chaperone CopZ